MWSWWSFVRCSVQCRHHVNWDLRVVWVGARNSSSTSHLGRERGAEKNFQALFKRDSCRGGLSPRLGLRKASNYNFEKTTPRQVTGSDLADNDETPIPTTSRHQTTHHPTRIVELRAVASSRHTWIRIGSTRSPVTGWSLRMLLGTLGSCRALLRQQPSDAQEPLV